MAAAKARDERQVTGALFQEQCFSGEGRQVYIFCGHGTFMDKASWTKPSGNRVLESNGSSRVILPLRCPGS